MPIYTWKNKKTDAIIDVRRPMRESALPPDESGDWERVFSFGIGRIEGAGGSPARTSK